MGAPSNSKEKEITSLVSYLIVSARHLYEEPKRYGPFRLIEACSRLIALLDRMGESNEFLENIRSRIESEKINMVTDEKGSVKFLDDLVLSVVTKIEQEPWD
jgi:hypothetical protein